MSLYFIFINNHKFSSNKRSISGKDTSPRNDKTYFSLKKNIPQPKKVNRENYEGSNCLYFTFAEHTRGLLMYNRACIFEIERFRVTMLL